MIHETFLDCYCIDITKLQDGELELQQLIAQSPTGVAVLHSEEDLTELGGETVVCQSFRRRGHLITDQIHGYVSLDDVVLILCESL